MANILNRLQAEAVHEALSKLVNCGAQNVSFTLERGTIGVILRHDSVLVVTRTEVVDGKVQLQSQQSHQNLAQFAYIYRL